MDSFPTSRAGKLAELEAMQMAGTARQNPFGRTSNPDVAPLAFDESQARATWSPCSACIVKSWSCLLCAGISDSGCMVSVCQGILASGSMQKGLAQKVKELLA